MKVLGTEIELHHIILMIILLLLVAVLVMLSMKKCEVKEEARDNPKRAVKPRDIAKKKE